MNSKRSWSFLVVGTGAVLLAACTTTQQSTVRAVGHQVRLHRAGVLAAQNRRPGAADRVALHQSGGRLDQVQEAHDPAGHVLGRREFESLGGGTAPTHELSTTTTLEQETGQAFQLVDQDGPDSHAAVGGPTDVGAAAPSYRTDHDGDSSGPRVGDAEARRTDSYPSSAVHGGVQADRLPDRPSSGGGRGSSHRGGNISTAAQWEWGEAET